MTYLANHIDGSAREPLGKAWLDGLNPATGTVIHQVPDSDDRDIELAVAAAKAAFPEWSRTPSTERARLLNTIADGIERRLDALAMAESMDQGKTVQRARTIEIPRAAANFRYYAGAILHHTETCTHMDNGALNYTHRKPLGVAGLISPWNLPLYLLTWKIAPALATGNTAVAKPSELTSLTAHLLGEIFEEAGLPAGVCNLVLGTGQKAGAALVRHPDVPLISFTGGTRTALSIQQDAAPHFKKLSLELGGKNANIIFDDADLEGCLPVTVQSSFGNQGEICLCGSRIFVQRGIYPEFLERFATMTAAMRVGEPNDPKTDLGALISKAHRDKVEGYIALAREEGGTIVTGGKRPGDLPGRLAGGFFLEPTIITDLAPDSRVHCDEIFGPVVTVTPFETEAEAVALANQSRYGLSGTVWTRDLTRGHRTAQQIDAGVIWVNCWLFRDLRTPFGGMKQSGIGREGGRYALEFFTETQNICVNIPMEA